MSIRLKFACVSVLLCVALVTTILAAAGTVQAYQQFEQNHRRIQAGDVNTISAWMTLPYISRVYRVPETCLDTSLPDIRPAWREHTTLAVIADRTKKPLDYLIHLVQQVVLNYRKQPATCTVANVRVAEGWSS